VNVFNLLTETIPAEEVVILVGGCTVETDEVRRLLPGLIGRLWLMHG
jgi:shikimate kinase